MSEIHTLEIFLLCHNRPEDAKQAIRSILAQNNQNFTLIISDNSTDDRVESMVREIFPKENYIRRKPVSATRHCIQCISEVSSSHFCLFHDDDLMCPDFVHEAMMAIAAFPSAVAIGSNSYIEVKGKTQKKFSFAALHQYESVKSAKDLANRYFSPHQSGIAPFPGYIYQKKRIHKFYPLENEGKYSDVTWLLRLIQTGPFVWIRKPIMVYRLHGGNDGLTESRRDRLRFLAYLKKMKIVLGNEILENYRYSFIYKPINKSKIKQPLSRKCKASKFIQCHRWKRYFRINTYISIIKRKYIKYCGK